MRKFFFLFSALLFSAGLANAALPFVNLDEYKNSLGFSRFYNLRHSQSPLRIAIIARDFSGLEGELGRTLPISTRLIESTPDHSAKPFGAPPINGTQVAQILTSLMTNDLKAPQWTPELTLYKVQSFKQLQKAITHLLSQQTDLVLNTELWAAGSNFDGTGFLPMEVSRATSKGALWLNVAGDFADSVFRSEIQSFQDDWVRLPDPNNALMIRCENNPNGKCPVSISLTWNSFSNSEYSGTNKDLDLALTDDMLNIISTSTQKQSADPNENRPGYSKIPEEFITTSLSPGVYFLRVKNRSRNFTGRDQLQLAVDGHFIKMPSHQRQESLLSPADNFDAITIGANDSTAVSTSVSLDKSDIFAPSRVDLRNGEKIFGSHSAAAIVAAGVALVKTENPHLQRAEILAKVRGASGDWNQRGLPLRLLAFNPTGPGCFWDVLLNPIPNYMREVISKGGVPVETTAAIRIMVPFDPITVTPYLRRYAIDDMIVALPWGGYDIFPRYGRIPDGAIEIFQRPQEAGLCRPRPNGKNFHL